VVVASPNENAELLWGLRGGGGNFGVATRLDFRLHPLDGVVGGTLTYRGDGVREGLRRFRDVAAASPRELSCQAGLAVDDAIAPVLGIYPCYTGSNGDPEELRVLRGVRGLVEDGVGPRTYAEQQRMFDSPYGENRHYWKGHFVRELPDELLDVLVERVAALGRSPGGILLESLHGAPKRADPQSSALGFRDAAFNISAMATWQDAAFDEEHIAWARETAAAIEPWAVSGGYMNYMQADEPIERVRAAFGDGTFQRLQELKSRYDPGNVLHRNQNIPPA
jgi:FAD/FMN-containing dehydrogenase